MQFAIRYGLLTQATNYSYDYLGNLTQVNEGNQLRSFKYDSISRLLYEKIPEQSATINDGTGTFWSCKYTYTTFNAVATKQDARGVIATYSYDTLNRMTQVSYNTVTGVTTAPTMTYVYDTDPTYGTTASGMVVRVNVGSDYQERYTFDANKRVSSTIRTIGSRTYTTSYTYNQASQLTQLTYPSLRAINVSHDSVGRLSGLAESDNGPTWLASVTYNGIGQVTGTTLGNGVSEVFGYDANRMQLTSQKAGTVSPYTNRMNLTYSYQATAGQMGAGSTAGNADQLMTISGTINGTTESAAYTYDNLSRLVTSNQTTNGSSAQRRFAYDRWANRTGMWDAVSGGNQIQSVVLQQSGGAPTNRLTSVTTSGVTANYTYDAAGNVTNDGVHSYTYDSENRLVSVDGGATAGYAYANQNRRYKKTVGSTVTHYIWQGSQVLAEHNGSTGAVITDYISSSRRMIAKVASGTTQYFLSDRLSERLVLDSSGNAIGRMAHLPFGEDFGESGTQDKHHFTSYERDAETGSDYAINRGYSASLGRFVSVDRRAGSIGGPQSLNLFAYTRNDPINRTDRLGLDDEPCYVFNPGTGEWEPTDCGDPVVLHGEDDPWPDDPFEPAEDNYELFIDGGFGLIPGLPGVAPADECRFDVLLSGPPVGHYPDILRRPDFDPNTTRHGPGISKDRLWFFYFEVRMTWITGTRGDWRFFVSAIATSRYELDLGNGQTERLRNTTVRPEDNPGTNQVDLSSPSAYLFFDAPGFPMSARGSDGLLHPVIRARVQFLISIRGVGPGGGSCSKSLFLALTIEPGKRPDWLALQGP